MASPTSAIIQLGTIDFEEPQQGKELLAVPTSRSADDVSLLGNESIAVGSAVQSLFDPTIYSFTTQDETVRFGHCTTTTQQQASIIRQHRPQMPNCAGRSAMGATAAMVETTTFHEQKRRPQH